MKATFGVEISEAGTRYVVNADPALDRTSVALGVYAALFYIISHPEAFVASVGADPQAFLRGVQEQVERDKRAGIDPTVVGPKAEGVN